jgi:hypothetical protein
MKMPQYNRFLDTRRPASFLQPDFFPGARGPTFLIGFRRHRRQAFAVRGQGVFSHHDLRLYKITRYSRRSDLFRNLFNFRRDVLRPRCRLRTED